MITIFTPIYNRAYIVSNLYHSLLHQTCYEFEWLIVDDGSTDYIALLVDEWVKNTSQFVIRFYHQENKGKHAAINYGVKLSDRDAFFIVDSDDYLEKDAVKTITRYWKDISTDNGFAGISGLRKNKYGRIIGGTPAFAEYIDASNLDREKYGLDGDKAEVYKTRLLRKFPFPEYENEKFISEAVVWDKLAYEGYKMRWINKEFVICDYLKDGLTAKGEKIFIANPKGWAHYIRTEFKCREINARERLKKSYYFYECECTRFTKEEIKELLNLDIAEFEIIMAQYDQFVQKLWRICENKKIGIYGYGHWGKRLKRYLDYLYITVDYVIDRKYKDINDIAAYSIEMEIPEVDIIFIALNIDADETAKIVESKMNGTRIIICKDIVPESW